LPRGHAAIAFVDVGVEFADRATVVVAVGFLRIYGFLHISICITPETMDTNRLPKQALQYKPKGRRNVGRPRKRWRDQLHLEDQRTGNTPNSSGT